MAEVEYRCFVGGLAWATTDRSLEDAFAQYGEVIDSKVEMKCSFDIIHLPLPYFGQTISMLSDYLVSLKE
ncbi:hypothetical protein RJ640_016413 [Escallonia rubra]|uniref:RRM domain-containing protein n=1 Tax=Escallonia rubra TaxID=112253 RepID=A0AA88RNT7_9ASTE|nr:hypothetical protein RJ640_016413 [Escallonia rubra]